MSTRIESGGEGHVAADRKPLENFGPFMFEESWDNPPSQYDPQPVGYYCVISGGGIREGHNKRAKAATVRHHLLLGYEAGQA